MSSQGLDLARLLYTNDPLAPDEKQLARSKVAALQEQLNGLRLLCQQVQNEIADHKLLLSPWREIPHEVLGEIFVLMVPHVVTYESRQDLTDLRLVCKRWRDAADLTHRLWSGLAIDVEDESLSYEKIATWYSRSGDVRRSLDVYPNWHSKEDMDSCRLLHPVLYRLFTEGPRIDKLTIKCVAVACFERFAQAFHSNEARGATSLPWHAIRSCAISFVTDYWTWDTPNPHITTIFPPSLSSLTFTSKRRPAHWREESNMLSFIQPTVLQHLTYFNVQCNWHQSLLSILSTIQHCKNVEVLFLAGGHEADYTRTPVQALETFFQQGIHLSRVKTLRIGGACSYFISWALKALQTPNAVDLDIDFTSIRCCTTPLRSVMVAGGDREIVWWSRISPSLRAFKRLRYMRLRSMEMNSSTLAKLLKKFPSLIHLTLVNFSVSEDLYYRSLEEPTHQSEDFDGDLGWPCIEVVELLGKTKEFGLSYIQDLVVTGAPYVIRRIL
jgi:hypothetical protein